MPVSVLMQRSASQPARAAHGPPEMSLDFISAEAGRSGAFGEADFLYTTNPSGVRRSFQPMSHGRHDKMGLKFTKWLLLMRLKKK